MTTATDGLARLDTRAPRSHSGDRLGTAVVATLVDDIVRGAYPAGASLPPEAELGERFGVSRTVVRESVKLLQHKGLVTIRQGVGTVVRAAEAWNVIDDDVLTALVRTDDSLTILDELVAVRASLERDLAAAAASRATSADATARIRDALRAMADAADGGATFAAADVVFHDAVMELSGRRLARAIVASLHGKARTTGRYVGAISATYTELTLTEHRAILAAIEAGDSVRAAASMHAHIVGSWARRRPVEPSAPPPTVLNAEW